MARHRGERAQSGVFQRREEQRSRAEFDERRHLTHVGVADDHVQSAKPLGVGVRFVTGVDDRALQGRLKSHDLFEEFGARTQLEEWIALQRGLGLGAHLAGAHNDLTRDEMRHHGAHDVVELDVTTHEIVLVGAVRVALAIGVVLVERNSLGRFDQFVGDRERASHDFFAGGVIERRLQGRAALG